MKGDIVSIQNPRDAPASCTKDEKPVHSRSFSSEIVSRSKKGFAGKQIIRLSLN